jgi:hypothetical protein
MAGAEYLGESGLEPKFQYYEIVRVTKSKYPEHVGKLGAVLSRPEDDQKQRDYAICFYDFEEVWIFDEDELESTGKIERRETFYSGDSIRVRVDPDTGVPPPNEFDGKGPSPYGTAEARTIA